MNIDRINSLKNPEVDDPVNQYGMKKSKSEELAKTNAEKVAKINGTPNITPAVENENLRTYGIKNPTPEQKKEWFKKQTMKDIASDYKAVSEIPNPEEVINTEEGGTEDSVLADYDEERFPTPEKISQIPSLKNKFANMSEEEIAMYLMNLSGK